MLYSNEMLHYMFKAEFVTLVSLKSPVGLGWLLILGEENSKGLFSFQQGGKMCYVPNVQHVFSPDMDAIDRGATARIVFLPESVRFMEENREMFQREFRINPMWGGGGSQCDMQKTKKGLHIFVVWSTG